MHTNIIDLIPGSDASGDSDPLNCELQLLQLHSYIEQSTDKQALIRFIIDCAAHLNTDTPAPKASPCFQEITS